MTKELFIIRGEGSEVKKGPDAHLIVIVIDYALLSELKGESRMRYVDEACAWLIFLAGVVHIVLLEVLHWRGGVLDTGLLYILVAMFNLLRIRSGSTVKLLKVFCLGANVSALMLELARWNMFGRSSSLGLEAATLGLLLLFLLQTLLSVIRKQ
jgi:hypothetical protein